MLLLLLFLFLDLHIELVETSVKTFKRVLGEDPWFQEQRKRQQQVQKVCQEHGNLLSPLTIPLTYFSFIPKYNMIYCRIQKCGTSNWILGIFKRLAPELGLHSYNSQNILDKINNFEVKSIESWETILKGNPLSFVVVRHPFERLASGMSWNRYK